MTTGDTPQTRPAGRRASIAARLRRPFSRHGAQPALSASVRAIRDTAADAQRSRLPQMAAALSYRTIFGLIPMLVVALVAIKAFFATDADMAKVLNDAFQYAGLADIAVQEAREPDPSHWASLGGTPVYLPPPEVVAEARVSRQGGSARLDQWITVLVQRVGEIRWGTIGLIGIATLLYAAISMLVELERAFNQIYRVPIGRSWPRRIMQYWTILTLGSLFLVATFYVGEQFKSWAVDVAARQGFVEGGTGGGITIALIGYAVTVAISTLLFLLAYTTVPNTRVALHAALAGALVAAILWEAGKWGFTQYVRFSASASYARLYGSIALIPLFLLWVYFTWLITLFGLQVAYQLQHVQQRTVAKPTEDLEPVIVDPSAMLSIAGLLAERFQNGEPATADEVAARLAIRKPIAARMLDTLVSSSLAHKIDRGSAEKAYALARPPERIDAEELLRVGEGLAGGDHHPDHLSDALRRTRVEFIHGKSLAALIAANGSATANAAPVPGAPREPEPAAESPPTVPPNGVEAPAADPSRS